MRKGLKIFLSILLILGISASCFFILPIVIGDPIADRLVYHPAEGDRKWGYFHYIPEPALGREEVRTVLYLHTGQDNLNYEELISFVQWFHLPRMMWHCMLNGYALLCVITPRPYGEYPIFKLNSQAMTQWTMFSNDFDIPAYDFYKRPDLEFLKAFDDFLNFLTGYGKTAYTKLFVTGFSAGGTSANRFTMLHPDRVAAVAIGGSGLYMFPNATWQSEEIAYPLGIADVTSIPDTSYNEEILKTIPHLFMIGENDVNQENDPAAFEDSLNSTQIAFVEEYFGSEQVQRTHYYHNNLTLWGYNSHIRVYSGIGHQYTMDMRSDTFNFFNTIAP